MSSKLRHCRPRESGRRGAAGALLLYAIATAVAAAPSFAAGEIRAGAARFAWGNFGETDPIFAGFSDLETGIGGPTDDHLHQHWFYLRGEAAAREEPLPPPATELYAGDQFELTWQGVGETGFDARLTGVLEQRGLLTAHLREELEISNPTTARIDVVLFIYADIDVQLGFGGNPDTAALVSRGRVRIDDQGLFDFGEFASPGAVSYEADAWPGLRDFQLADTGPDDLNETGYPFGPAHYSGAFAWHLALEPGGSATIPIVLSVNTPSIEESSLARVPPRARLDPGDLFGVTWPGLSVDLDPFTGGGHIIGSTFWDRARAAAADSSGEVHVIGNFTLLRVTPNGSGRVVAQLPVTTARAMAFHPDDSLWAIVRDPRGRDELTKIDRDTGDVTTIGRTGLDGIEGLAWSPDGATLYAWHDGPQQTGAGLVTVDPTTGTATDPFPTTEETAEIRGLSFAPNGTLLGAHQALHTIHLDDGTTRERGAGGYFDLTGLAFAGPP